ncbi:UBA/THIF-type NAD/FAD binding protein [Corchorus olitorius]|uniref:UBA/THIF-type NAD/FAD binding protein n=1 Tax=Corchorus olitorius TaxID=93759 RepID=A0A1R3K5N7_9ROSI|nr:UBA/THIF-type NAD/FAD binding protein [Corchorus olitorius]
MDDTRKSRKRACEGEFVEGESENNNKSNNIKDVAVTSLIKKHRTIAPAGINFTADNNVTIGTTAPAACRLCSRDHEEAFCFQCSLLRDAGISLLVSSQLVTLHAERVVELWDLSSNFVFSENDVGKNRALASVQKLKELNNAVVISTSTTKLTEEQLSDFQAVVFTDVSLEKALEFEDYCHNHQPPISFIKTEVRGLFGSVYCDFGPEFTVFDVDVEEPHMTYRFEFQDGDLVVFSEVQGMKELNDGKPGKIKSARPYSFTLEEDTTNFGTYVKVGIVTQVKEPKVLNFKPFREALKDPGDFLLSDFSKFDRPPVLHIAFQALDKFISELGRFPVAGSEEDAQKLASLAANINDCLGEAKMEDVNPKLLRHFAFGARAVLNPMAAMFGGIVGQEVVKACSGKFHPFFQVGRTILSLSFSHACVIVFVIIYLDM